MVQVTRLLDELGVLAGREAVGELGDLAGALGAALRVLLGELQRMDGPLVEQYIPVLLGLARSTTFFLATVRQTWTTRFGAAQVGAAQVGVAQVRKVSTWQQVTQVLEFTTPGGEQQFVTYSFLEEDVEHQISTVKSASSFAMTIGDDAELPWYGILSDANDDRIPHAVSVVLPSGSAIYYNGYVTLNKTPTLTKNELMGLQSTVSLTSEPMRYAA